MPHAVIPPPTEPAATFLRAALAPLAEPGGPLAPGADGKARLVGALPTTPEADRIAGAPVVRLAVRVANRPDLPGYAGAMPGGPRAESTSRQWVRVELRAVAANVGGAKAAIERVLRRGLAVLLDDDLDTEAAARAAWGDGTDGRPVPEVALVGRPALSSGPTGPVFDGVDRDWTASAVVEVALETLAAAVATP